MGPERITLVGETLVLEYDDALYDDALLKIPVGDIDTVRIRNSWWAKLTVRLVDGSEVSVGGLGWTEAKRVLDAVLAEVKRVRKVAAAEAVRAREAALAEARRIHEAAVADAIQRGKALSPGLKRLDEKLVQLFSGERYVRHRDSRKLHEDLVSVVRQCEGLIGQHLEQGAREALDRLAPLKLVEKYEAARERANSCFVQRSITPVRAAAPKAPLTDEQAEAIATDEEVTLVLAGAGTGKTSVIVGKVAHLVRHQGVSPNEILVLAFNDRAAAEIRKRLRGNLSAAHVYTFHAFGNKIIKASEGVAPTLSELARDEVKLANAVDDILQDLMGDPQQSEAVIDFIAYHHAPYHSAFDFNTHAEYDEYVRSVELRTLSGDLVRSFEELAIANYLTEHDIEFRYEAPYKATTDRREHRQYRPDFFLPEHDIYIEHFALDERDRPPPGWEGYAEGVKWKRSIHEQDCSKSRLVETYSWQHRPGILLPRLRKQLEEAGVRFERVPRQTLISRLASELISWLAGLLAKFLNHVKAGGLSPSELRARASKAGQDWRASRFLDVFGQAFERYQQMLDSAKEIDFHDQINLAASHIREGRWQSPYRYVLVDEFQDISTGRMALLAALRNQRMAYFLVGDDWQSIYRFAGSDVSLVSGCGDYLGHVRKRILTHTFRFADGILKPSTAFVKRNVEDQTQRELRSASGAEDEGVTVVAEDDPARGVARVLQEIEANTRDRRRSVLVLGRYKKSRDALPTARSRSLQVEFSTIHRAKGQESDYVVVLDLKDDRMGFPCKFEDDPLLELVLPRLSRYPLAEERRLFYVAMTRARIGTYLVSDPDRPSEFVEELLRESGDELRQLGELALQCPHCGGGRLLPSQGHLKLRCPKCTHPAPLCPNCRVGYALVSEHVAECSYQGCKTPPDVCPSCGIGVLLDRKGKYGAFLGCSEYGSEPSCPHTQDIYRGRVPPA